MKCKKNMPVTLAVVLAVLVLALGTAWAKTFYVQRNKVQIKKGRGAFYPTIHSAKKGDALEVLTEQGGWYQVQTPKGPGWVFAKALAEKKQGFSPLANLVGTAKTSDLDKTAGYKGFDEPTEKAYVAQHNLKAQMSQVDRLEKIPFSVAELKRFLKRGRLSPQGGGQ